MMLDNIPRAASDEIFAVNLEYRQDERLHKINLSIGVYIDDAGITPVMRAVKQAEAVLLENEQTKVYTDIGGTPAYAEVANSLLFGADYAPVDRGRIQTLQTPGGTGALRTALELVKRHVGDQHVWVSSPTWANHLAIASRVGLPIRRYTYRDSQSHSLDFPALLQDLSQAQAGDVVILHACCHNPTGVDFDTQQWFQLAQLCVEREILPLVDIAYQGFGSGLEADAQGVRILSQHCEELLVANSFSKNFGIYNERTGSLSIQTATADSTSNAMSELRTLVRANYSNPPQHGASLVTQVYADQDLRTLWQTELEQMRTRIVGTRQRFAERMKQAQDKMNFNFVANQNGMFSILGLTPEQVVQLREQHAVYVLNSGRMNFAGVRELQLDRVCEAICAVIAD